MSSPKPPPQYDQKDQTEVRRQLDAADRQNVKIGTDIEFVNNRLIMTSPDGTRWSLTVSNAGASVWTAL
jgi:hypothetical protein